MEDAPPLTHGTTTTVDAPVHNKPFIVATIIVVASAIKLPLLTNCHKMLSGIEWKWRKKFKGNLHLSLVNNNNKSLVLSPLVSSLINDLLFGVMMGGFSGCVASFGNCHKQISI